VNSLEAESATADAALSPTRRYRDSLSSNGKALSMVVRVGREEALDIVRALLPYDLPGEAIHKKLHGSFRLADPADLRFRPGGRVALRLVLTGRDVRVDMKGYDSYKKELSEAMTAGVELDLVVYTRVDNDRLKLQVQVEGVKLRAHDKSDYRSYIQNQLNAKLFAPAQWVPLPRALTGHRAWALTTESHYVIGY
jgi:hypothetical protein